MARPSSFMSSSRRRFVLGAAATFSLGAAGCASSSNRRDEVEPDAPLAAGGDDWARTLSALSPLPLPSPPDERHFSERRARARERMEALGHKALLLVATPNLRHLTGVRWWLSERLFGVIVPASGDPVWICPAFEEGRATERIKGSGEVRLWQEHEDPFALVARTLSDLGLAGSSIAVDPACPLAFLERLKSASSTTSFVGGGAITSWLRARKDEPEIAAMKTANEITRQALKAALSHLEEGMVGSVLGARVSAAQLKLGGATPWVLPLIGEAAAYPHGTEKEPLLQLGDGVLVDTGCQVNGYWSDLTRTVFFGAPDAKAGDAWEAVKRAQEAARVAAGPGVPAGDVDAAARQVLEAAGYGPGYRAFTHRLGHGIGLEVHEEPFLVQGNELVLEAGMTASDEPGVYLPGELGVRLEDILHITDEGAELLSEPQTAPTVDGL